MPKKREAFKAILRFLTHGDIKLKKEEEDILKRWEYCDSLLRGKSKNEQQIIDELVTRYTIKPHTARNDIYQTQQLFGKSRQINKKYLAHHHLERIDRDIQLLRSQLFRSENGKIITPDAKETMALAKLFEAYTYQLNSLPDEPIQDRTPPPIFHFILAPGQVIEKPMMIEDAMKQADKIILKLNTNGIEDAITDETGMDNTAEETE